MIGDGIFSGDLLIIPREIKVLNGDIIVANLNGNFICKRIDLKRQALMSSNKYFATYHLRDDEELKVRAL